MNKCPYCGTVNPEENRACRNCRAELPKATPPAKEKPKKPEKGKE